MKKHLEELCYTLEHSGMEVDETRLPKINRIKIAITLLNNIIENNFIEQAEKKLEKTLNDIRTPKEKKNDSEIYEMANLIEKLD